MTAETCLWLQMARAVKRASTRSGSVWYSFGWQELHVLGCFEPKCQGIQGSSVSRRAFAAPEPSAVPMSRQEGHNRCEGLKAESLGS